jgi:DNA-binding CsgD family transcriptional regulator
MMNTITMLDGNGERLKVFHRIFYFHEGSAVRYALCLYTPIGVDRPSAIADSMTGEIMLLAQIEEGAILSEREKEILRMIDKGMSSKEISEMLYISIHTVSRHRQNILEKLHAKNSSHACNVAKSLRLI